MELNERVNRLKQLRSAGEIRRFRVGLTREEAQETIKSPQLTPVERGAILLCMHFADTDPRSYQGGSWIIDPQDFLSSEDTTGGSAAGEAGDG